LKAIKRSTGYFIEAHPRPDVLYGEVVDGYSDPSWWERMIFCIVLKPTWPGGSIWDPTNPGLEPGRVEEKIEKVMTRCDPAG
jgi:hypothetical protein